VRPGYDVVTFTRTLDVREELVTSGPSAGTAPADAAAADTTTIAMLPNGAAIVEVLSGAEGVLPAAEPGMAGGRHEHA
jgi:3-hydroxyisobutyrate dehydrogenase-like beta-hydroxyacid dehydrogenase